jgi:heterotetrameric sarcosine oxidase gamma subunit
VVKLIAQSAGAGLLPVTVGSVTLTEVDLGPVTSVAAFRGKADAVASALASAVGIAPPGPNGTASGPKGRMVWVGEDRVLVVGAAVPAAVSAIAAVVDQSDASITLRIQGSGAETVLARLVPVDLRLSRFALGQTARTLVGHMMVSITRVGDDAFEIMAFRSMAGSLVHDLTGAAQGVAAR